MKRSLIVLNVLLLLALVGSLQGYVENFEAYMYTALAALVVCVITVVSAYEFSYVLVALARRVIASIRRHQGKTRRRARMGGLGWIVFISLVFPAFAILGALQGIPPNPYPAPSLWFAWVLLGLIFAAYVWGVSWGVRDCLQGLSALGRPEKQTSSKERKRPRLEPQTLRPGEAIFPERRNPPPDTGSTTTSVKKKGRGASL